MIINAIDTCGAIATKQADDNEALPVNVPLTGSIETNHGHGDGMASTNPF